MREQGSMLDLVWILAQIQMKHVKLMKIVVISTNQIQQLGLGINSNCKDTGWDCDPDFDPPDNVDYTCLISSSPLNYDC